MLIHIESTHYATQSFRSGRLSKSLGWWSLIGISFSLTNTWLGMASSLVVGLTNGGPMLIIYGLIIAMFFALMGSIAISDFASMLPNASGLCFWTLKLLSEPLQDQNIQNHEHKISFSKNDFEIKEDKLCIEIREKKYPEIKEDDCSEIQQNENIEIKKNEGTKIKKMNIPNLRNASYVLKWRSSKWSTIAIPEMSYSSANGKKKINK